MLSINTKDNIKMPYIQQTILKWGRILSRQLRGGNLVYKRLQCGVRTIKCKSELTIQPDFVTQGERNSTANEI